MAEQPGFVPISHVGSTQKSPWITHFNHFVEVSFVFDILKFASGNYFDYRYPTGSRPHRPLLARIGAINLLYRFMPPVLKPGYTVVARSHAGSH